MSKNTLQTQEKIENVTDSLQIIQNNSLPKFGIDALILADFIDDSRSQRQRAADFGSGSGIIGLAYARKSSGKISLIEIDSDLFELEKRSIQLNNLEDRVQSFQADVNQLADIFPLNSLDLIMSNPPYFDEKDYASKSPDPSRSLARHGRNFNLHTLFSQSKKYLKSRGKLYFVYRAEKIANIFSEAIANGFGISKIRFVYGKAESQAKMVLVKAIKQASNAKVQIDKPLVIYNRQDNYTPEIKELLQKRDYYFYVIQTADNFLYAGTSDDVDRRFAAHQAKRGAKFTKVDKHHPLTLVYREKFSSKHEALSFESRFKRLTRAEKERYIGL
ncbi:methyltransferase [Oenococcus kitaharae]|uniref:Putative O-methyltransferase n=1 Tax=Oenococcus kitaharae DSM 17330 TaxID=1045004 RepID=G9WH68_9LACO|nr:methyltransferase [Oenococcus kitaharae]EHN59557.1 Putative O-methyltransferase [Oenococcus kitaharae DSM 17330]OEY83410.1 methyltransferase [Oenococcus kitaharae]OEY85209.1 methyltransferase [Oenococcus kitaharae]OEY86063.1 methyltransferase [Oenococcus kitaharae]